MARKSSTAWLRIAAPILIALGLVGCLWALIGLYRGGLSPALSPTSTMTPIPPTAISSLTSQLTFTPLPSTSPTAIPSPTSQPTPAPLPSATPTPTPAEASSQQVAPEKSALAPDFSLPQVGGGSAQLSAFRGQPVLLSFWATWCPYCRRQIPVLKEAYDRYKAQGLVVLGVDIQEEEEQVAAAMRELEVSYPVLLDATGQTARLYRVRGIPFNLFIDSQGVISAIYPGSLDGETLDKYLASILPSVEEEEPAPEVGKQAPDFSLPNAQGGTFTLSDLRGKCKVVLVFYHHIC